MLRVSYLTDSFLFEPQQPSGLMKVHKLNVLFKRYADALHERGEVQPFIPYKILERFRYHWDIEAKDFERMYDDSFGGASELWEGNDYYPKQSMLQYIRMNPDLVHSMFIDLYDENRDIIGRIHRFIDQCDQLRIYYSKGITRRASHYHGDKRMIFVYLSMMSPASYCLLHSQGFEKVLKLVDAKPMSRALEIERYIKTSRTIAKLMENNEEIKAYIQKSLPSNFSCEEASLFFVYDFLSLDFF